LLAPLPVGGQIEQAFLSRIERLAPEPQTLLLVLAAEDSGSLATVARAAARLGADIGALDAAERAGLVRAQGARLAFRHPLIRSVVYQTAPSSRRRAAHAAIAAVLDPETEGDRRAWHRAAASVGPDPSVAGDLEQAARRAQQRSGFAAASLAFERAAALAEGAHRSEERRVGKECRSRWSPYH